MEPRRVNPWLVLVIVGIAQFMVILDATIVNVALPSIQRGLHFSPSSLQWIVNAYTLAFGGFLMLGGRAADLLGRRRLFLLGIVLFSAASLMNGLAGSAGILVAGRALQGLGGALVTPAALSVLTTTFAEGRERTAALGVWSAIAVGGGAIGLLLGGVLTSLLSWQWIFFVNVPVGVIAIALALRFMPESRVENARGGVDIAGAVSVTGGLVVLVYALVNAQTAGWLSTGSGGPSTCRSAAGSGRAPPSPPSPTCTATTSCRSSDRSRYRTSPSRPSRSTWADWWTRDTGKPPWRPFGSACTASWPRRWTMTSC